MKQQIYNAALYMRLSRDDELQGDSSSIQTQRMMLRQYAQEHGIRIVGEYIDATVIIGLKQNPTHGRRFSPIFFALSGILWGKTQDATMNQGGKQNTVRAKAFIVSTDSERLFLYPKPGGSYERND